MRGLFADHGTLKLDFWNYFEIRYSNLEVTRPIGNGDTLSIGKEFIENGVVKLTICVWNEVWE